MRLKIWLAMFSVYIFWGGTYLAIRFAVESLPPFLMAGVRWLIAGSFLYLWMRLSRTNRPTLKQWKTTAVVGLFLLVGGNGLLSWAEQDVISSVAAIIIATVPLWIVVLDAIRPNAIKPTWQTISGVLVGFIGIIILINPFKGFNQIRSGEWLGMFALLMAALFWSIGSIYSRDNHAHMPEQPLLASGMEMLAGGGVLLLIGTITGEWHTLKMSEVSIQSLLGVAYLIVFGSFIAYVSYTWLLNEAPTPLVSTYAYVNPLVAVVLGSLLAHEVIDLRILVATALIIGAVILTNTSRWKRFSGAQKPELQGSINHRI